MLTLFKGAEEEEKAVEIPRVKDEDTALVYIDGYDALAAKNANRLIEAEMTQMAKQKADREMVEEAEEGPRKSGEVDLRRYDGEVPGKEERGIENLRETRRKLQICVSAEYGRGEDLALAETYSREAWTEYLREMDRVKESLQKECDAMEEQLGGVHDRRAAAQNMAKEQIRALRAQYVAGIQKNTRLRGVIADMRRKVRAKQ